MFEKSKIVFFDQIEEQKPRIKKFCPDNKENSYSQGQNKLTILAHN